jgi:hypothetical protein
VGPGGPGAAWEGGAGAWCSPAGRERSSLLSHPGKHAPKSKGLAKVESPCLTFGVTSELYLLTFNWVLGGLAKLVEDLGKGNVRFIWQRPLLSLLRGALRYPCKVSVGEGTGRLCNLDFACSLGLGNLIRCQSLKSCLLQELLPCMGTGAQCPS